MQNFEETNSEFSSPCVDNSPKNQEKSKENQSKSTNIGKNTEKTSVFTENTDTSSGKTEVLTQSSDSSADSISNLEKNDDKSNKTTVGTTFEEVIDRDFEDFKTIFPNITKKCLLEDQNFRIFAEGKENKSISVSYAKYRKIVENISNEAVLQEKARQNNANTNIGALSSTQNANNTFFTREQVQNMSPSEIKRNYDLIRQSQQKW